jgi:hypothetical protein
MEDINWNQVTKAAIIAWIILGGIAILKWIGNMTFTLSI